jgi:Bacterial PH domain/Short C-terminal domain
MGFAESLLSTGERIVHREKQHWFVFVWGARFSILAIVLAGVLLWLSQGLDPAGFTGGIQFVIRWVVVAMFIAGLVVLAWTALRYRNQEYVLTNRRVMQVGGVLNKHSADSSLEKINDAVLTQSIFGRMLNFGDLEVLTASDIGIDKFKMIRGPIDFKKAMLDAKHEYEVDMERQSWPPSPPLKPKAPDPFTGDAGTTVAPTPALAAMPAPAATPEAPAATPPVAAAPRATDPDDVTRTLASLADLRDRGAITVEEYEQKKADLLGRL